MTLETYELGLIRAVDICIPCPPPRARTSIAPTTRLHVATPRCSAKVSAPRYCLYICSEIQTYTQQLGRCPSSKCFHTTHTEKEREMRERKRERLFRDTNPKRNCQCLGESDYASFASFGVDTLPCCAMSKSRLVQPPGVVRVFILLSYTQYTYITLCIMFRIGLLHEARVVPGECPLMPLPFGWLFTNIFREERESQTNTTGFFSLCVCVCIFYLFIFCSPVTAGSQERRERCVGSSGGQGSVPAEAGREGVSYRDEGVGRGERSILRARRVLQEPAGGMCIYLPICTFTFRLTQFVSRKSAVGNE